MRVGSVAVVILACAGCGGGGGGGGLPALAVERVAEVTSTAANTVAIGTYADGSFVLAGGFDGSAVFGSGEPNQTTLTNAGAFFSDVFVARYEADGSLRWARGFGSAGVDYATAVAALPDGSTIVAGQFEDQVTLGPGEPNETILIGVGAGDYDIFLALYAADGSLVWASVAGGQGNQWVGDLSVLAGGSCYITGSFQGEAVFGPGEAGETTVLAAGAGDVYLARYQPDGSLLWARSVGGVGFDEGEGLATLPDGGCAVAGYVNATVVFGAGEPNETTLVVADAEADGFLARFAADGTLRWARSGVVGAGAGDFVDVDLLSGGSLVVVGQYEGTITFDAGGPNETTLFAVQASSASLASIVGFPDDGFACSYGQDGSFRWARGFGDPDAQDTESKRVAALPDGRFVIASSFNRQLVVDGHGSVASSSTTTLFLLLCGADGEPEALSVCGGDGGDYVDGVATFPDGSFMVTGWSSSGAFKCGSKSAGAWVGPGMFAARYAAP